jgi:cytochrome c-type biogenesis protein CcmH/NrfF
MSDPRNPAGTADQVDEKEILLNEKAKALFRAIRCLECGSGQNIEFSNAPTAVALRDRVRKLLRDGLDSETIRDYLTQEYGQSVWFQESDIFWTDPVLRGLWLGGALLGGLVGVTVLRRRGTLSLTSKTLASPRLLTKTQIRQLTQQIVGQRWRWSAAEERTLQTILSPPAQQSGVARKSL